MRYRLFLLLIFCTTFGFCQLDATLHRTLTSENGLELNAIRAMVFDNDGFLWLGGEDYDVRTILNTQKVLTLQRFNGHIFHNIPLPDVGARIFKVDQLFKRDDGQIYVHIVADNGQHLYLLNPITSIFKTVDLSTDLQLSLSDVFDYDGKNYILTQDDKTITVNILNDDLSLTALFNFQRKGRPYEIETLTVFLPNENGVLIGDDNFSLIAFDWKGNVLKEYPSEPFNQKSISEITKPYITKYFLTDGIYHVLFKDDEKLYHVHPETFDVTPVITSESILKRDGSALLSDSKKSALFCTLLDETIGFSTYIDGKFQKSASSFQLDKDGAIQMVSTDFKTDVWVGYGNNQLHHFKFSESKIKTAFKGYSIRSLYELDNENILVTTESNGWFSFNPESGQTTPLTIKAENRPIKPVSSRNIIKAEDDQVWSSDIGNLLKIDLKPLQTETYRHFPIMALERLNDTTLVYATNRYNLMGFNTRSKTHYPLAKTDTLEIFDIEIKDDQLVGATDKGILLYDFSAETVDLIQHNDSEKTNFYLMADYHEDDGFLVGSRDGRIERINFSKKETVTVYQDELKAGIATILFKDEYWWINTFNGLVKYNTQTKNVLRFNTSDGLSHNEGNRYSALQTKNQLFFGQIDGLNYFKPEDLEQPPITAELVQLRTKSFSEKKQSVIESFNRDSLAKAPIILPVENKVLELDIGLTKPLEHLDYMLQYTLNGHPTVSLKPDESIKFQYLGAGNYQLVVEALDLAGQRIGKPLELQITSKNVFYKTVWFYILVALLIGAVLTYFFFQEREKRKMSQHFSQELIRSMEDERSRISKELHDGIGQKLTLVKKMEQRQGNTDIAEITNNALEEVRSISRNLYPPILNKLGLTETINELVHEIEQQTDLLVYSEVDDIDEYFNQKESLNVYRFIQECANNTIKHAQASSFTLKVEAKHKTVTIEVSDNGIGFNTSENIHRTSLGLRTLKERIQILGGDLDISSKPNKGTTITAKL